MTKSLLLRLTCCLLTTMAAFGFSPAPGQAPQYQFKGANGWTLEQDKIQLINGESRRGGTIVDFFHSDGRRKTVSTMFWRDGTADLMYARFYLPGIGVLHEDYRRKRRFFVGERMPTYGPVDITRLRRDPQYHRDEVVLGYLCTVRRWPPPGEVREVFLAVERGGAVIKSVISGKERSSIDEPTAIKLDNPPEAAFAANTDWPVSFEEYEQNIALMEKKARADHRYAASVNAMREELTRAKARLQPPK